MLKQIKIKSFTLFAFTLNFCIFNIFVHLIITLYIENHRHRILNFQKLSSELKHFCNNKVIFEYFNRSMHWEFYF